MITTKKPPCTPLPSVNNSFHVSPCLDVLEATWYTISPSYWSTLITFFTTHFRHLCTYYPSSSFQIPLILQGSHQVSFHVVPITLSQSLFPWVIFSLLNLILLFSVSYVTILCYNHKVIGMERRKPNYTSSIKTNF